jgi:uncharacterized protein (DUF488 family)
MKPVIYTVGHSVHKADYFLELLRAHKVNSIIDVRSIAASRFNPQFIKSRLSAFLEANGIRYFHLHEEFGARQKKLELLDEIGRVDFEKMRASNEFRSGIQFLKGEIALGFIPALMCAEADPLECHRFSMISVALKNDFRVRHILKDKSVVENEDLEKALLKKFRKKLTASSLFEETNGNEQLEIAFRLMNDRIGYRLG